MPGDDDVYRNILKEIGAEEANVDYLFVDSDEEEEESDHMIPKSADPESKEALEMESETKSNHDATHESFVKLFESQEDKHYEENSSKSIRNGRGMISLTINTEQPETYDDNSLGESPVKPSPKSRPTWQKMLELANAEQEQLMNQMTNLRRAQQETSPRNRPRNGNLSTQANVDEKENVNLSSISSSSQIMRTVSTRNTKLQDEWISQQQESARLQDKLVVMQAKFHDQQQKWEKDQKELFSPAHSSKSKIPRWNAMASESNKEAATTPTVSIKVAPKTDWISPPIERTTHSTGDDRLRRELNDSKEEIRILQAQLDEARQIQNSQMKEIQKGKDQLKTRDVEYESFLLRYETEKKDWKDRMQAQDYNHKHELAECNADLENARRMFEDQIAVNQNLRDAHEQEFTELMTRFEALKCQMEVARQENEELKTAKECLQKKELETNQIDIYSEIKSKVEEECESRLKDLERRHNNELELLKLQLSTQKGNLEQKSIEITAAKEEAEARYSALERKHDKEIKEWQRLLNADIANNLEREIHNASRMSESSKPKGIMVIGADNSSSELLSPIRKAERSHTKDQKSDFGSFVDHSSLNSGYQSDHSESISNKIDNLMDEIGEMDLERTMILKEIYEGDDISKNEKEQFGTFTSHNVGNSVSPRSVTNRSGDRCKVENEDDALGDEDLLRNEGGKFVPEVQTKAQDSSDVSSDSEILDETLHLLNNLKNMMNNENNDMQHETSVLERLEVLSDLMQSQDQLAQRSFMRERESVINHTNTQYTSSSPSIDQEVSVSKSSIAKSKEMSSLWPLLVEELRNRCEFLERDRDECTRITEQILAMERKSHKASLEAAIATAERKGKEAVHQLHLELNLERNSIYDSICVHCQQVMRGEISSSR